MAYESRPDADKAGSNSDKTSFRADNASSATDKAGSRTDRTGSNSDTSSSPADNIGWKTDSGSFGSDNASSPSDTAGFKTDGSSSTTDIAGFPADGGGFGVANRSSFPDAKLAEDHVEQVFGGGLADDFADGAQGHNERALSGLSESVGLRRGCQPSRKPDLLRRS